MATLANLVSRRVLQRLRSVDPADLDAWWERVAPLLESDVAAGHDTAVRLTLRYLELHAAAEGVVVRPEPVALDRAQLATSLRVTGPVAFKQEMTRSGSPEAAQRIMTSKLPRAAQRVMLSGSRESTRRLVESDRRVLGYRRVTSGSPCAFCAMLASRGAVYKSAESAGEGHRWHDGCSCSTEVLYSRDEGPADQRWSALWQQAKDTTPDGVTTAVQFRRLVEGRA